MHLFLKEKVRKRTVRRRMGSLLRLFLHSYVSLFGRVFLLAEREKLAKETSRILSHSSGVMMTRRLGSSPSEWVATPLKPWSAEWMTRRS